MSVFTETNNSIKEAARKPMKRGKTTAWKRVKLSSSKHHTSWSSLEHGVSNMFTTTIASTEREHSYAGESTQTADPRKEVKQQHGKG